MARVNEFLCAECSNKTGMEWNGRTFEYRIVYVIINININIHLHTNLAGGIRRKLPFG